MVDKSGGTRNRPAEARLGDGGKIGVLHENASDRHSYYGKPQESFFHKGCPNSFHSTHIGQVDSAQGHLSAASNH
jgi:hypothetical protein